MKDPKSEIKKRFLKVMRMAIAEEWQGIKNEGQFAEMIDVFPQQIYHIKTEAGRHVTIEMIHNTCVKFGLNANYFITGDLPVKHSKSSAVEKLKKIEKILQS
jgi:hypothetical protein